MLTWDVVNANRRNISAAKLRRMCSLGDGTYYRYVRNAEPVALPITKYLELLQWLVPGVAQQELELIQASIQTLKPQPY